MISSWSRDKIKTKKLFFNDNDVYFVGYTESTQKCSANNVSRSIRWASAVPIPHSNEHHSMDYLHDHSLHVDQ